MSNVSPLVSTRDEQSSTSFIEAMLNPSAARGGLYTFKSLPTFTLKDIESFTKLSYAKLCEDIFTRLNLNLSAPVLEAALRTYEHFDNPLNPAPFLPFSENLFMLNLFSGPTRAFKDMALQPFGVLLSHFAKERKKPYLVLAATSGDTGPATLESLANKDYIKVVCLYPHGGTSDVQRLQMTTQSAHNCKVFGIEGNFDDAQSTLKHLLASKSFLQNLDAQGMALSAANSVNIGRIVFQIVYHIWAYVSLVKSQHIQCGEKLSIVVPSGNFGNILGAFFAKKMGLPLARLVVAANVNNVLSEFINTGVYDITSRQLIKSKSPAMDILKSSNVERVLYALFGDKRTYELLSAFAKEGKYTLTSAELALLQEDFSALDCSDEQCLQSIAEAFRAGFVLDSHSAIGYYVAKTLQANGSIDKSIFLATAEWSKFAPSVQEALIKAHILPNMCAMESKEVDKAAIEAICNMAHIELPKRIYGLFSKPEVQKEVLPIAQVEPRIIEWLTESKR